MTEPRTYISHDHGYADGQPPTPTPDAPTPVDALARLARVGYPTIAIQLALRVGARQLGAPTATAQATRLADAHEAFLAAGTRPRIEAAIAEVQEAIEIADPYRTVEHLLRRPRGATMNPADAARLP